MLYSQEYMTKVAVTLSMIAKCATIYQYALRCNFMANLIMDDGIVSQSGIINSRDVLDILTCVTQRSNVRRISTIEG